MLQFRGDFRTKFLIEKGDIAITPVWKPDQSVTLAEGLPRLRCTGLPTVKVKYGPQRLAFRHPGIGKLFRLLGLVILGLNTGADQRQQAAEKPANNQNPGNGS